MTSRDFAFWLQGFFELGGGAGGLDAEQVECIRRHLALVFVHEIDPAIGGDAEQLQVIHDGPSPPEWPGPPEHVATGDAPAITAIPHYKTPRRRPDGVLMRC